MKTTPITNSTKTRSLLLGAESRFYGVIDDLRLGHTGNIGDIPIIKNMKKHFYIYSSMNAMQWISSCLLGSKRRRFYR